MALNSYSTLRSPAYGKQRRTLKRKEHLKSCLDPPRTSVEKAVITVIEPLFHFILIDIAIRKDAPFLFQIAVDVERNQRNPVPVSRPACPLSIKLDVDLLVSVVVVPEAGQACFWFFVKDPYAY